MCYIQCCTLTSVFIQVRAIGYQDFEDALRNVRPSVSEKDLDVYLDWNKTFGSGGRWCWLGRI